MSRFVSTRIRYGKKLRPWIIRRRVQLAIDAVAAAAAMVLAYLLRLDYPLPASVRGVALEWAAVAAILYPLFLLVTHGYRTTWQFFGLKDLGALVTRTLPTVTLFLLARLLLGSTSQLPLSVILLWTGLTVVLSSLARIARRLDHEAVMRAGRESRRTLIVGTEESLPAAVRQLSTFGGFKIVGLLGDNLQGDNLQGMNVAGIRVRGTISDLATAILAQQADLVLASTADLPGIADIIETCADLNVHFRLLPSAHDITQNNVRVIKEVSPLTVRRGSVRESAELHPEVIASLTGQVALVTGAGGSIGSELARQIASTPVRKLVVLDQDENSIFELMNEIGSRGPIIPHIADVRDAETIRSIFSQHAPDVVFHAAAYKHVPLMEQNPCEAVITNVMGTREVARAAMEVGTRRMVVISTDKAVKPSSIMGASKRLAEMTVQHCAANTRADRGLPETQFACVRFGNVLGSRGSVLPTFLKQIAAGGPITVTNAEMTRYFMTIPQAVRLVLQASTLASHGDIYMLDMGDPVRIMDFARDVIQSCGLVVDRDIEIKVVGTRPGEKLHEQLWNEDAEISQTDFPQVYRVHASAVPERFTHELDRLIVAARERRSDEVRALLGSMPVDYDVARAHVEPALAESSLAS